MLLQLLLLLPTLAAVRMHARAAGWYEVVHGAGNRSVRTSGDGRTDDTASFRAAIDHGRGGKGTSTRRRPSCTFPPGTYAISDTLVLWYWTSLQGNAVCPPTLKLLPGSQGFGDASAYKPVLATTAGYNQPVDAATGYNYSWWSGDIDANCNFYTQLDTCASPSASATQGPQGSCGVAQQTSMRDVR